MYRCWEAVGEHQQVSGGVGVVRDVLGAGREYRYSGARRGIGIIRGYWSSPRWCMRCWGVVRGHQWMSGVYWGWQGV